MKKFTLFLLSLLILSLSAQNQSTLDGVAVSNTKIPFYNKGNLQSMIFAEKAEYRAMLLHGYNVIINMLQKKVDPDRIQNDWNLKLYPLNAPLKDVLSFWRKRLYYCDAVIFTSEGVVQQSERTAYGDKQVQLRSPMMDLDGVGFAADFKKHEIKVNSAVRIVMRTAKSDPRVLKGVVPAEYEFMTANSDMLHLDTARHRLMLLGHVTVSDKQMRLTCDRLTIVLGGGDKKNKESNLNFNGVKTLYADGNVKVSKILPPGAPASESQEMTGDHMVYDNTAQVMTVTGDRVPPAVKNGKGFLLRGKELIFLRSKMQMIIPAECWLQIEEKGVKRYLIADYGNFNFNTGICDFLGNVRGSAPQHELACQKMRLFLQRSKKQNAVKKEENKASSTLPLSGGNLNTGSMEFQRLICRGHVNMFRRETKGVSTLKSDEAELNYITDKALFTGNVRCTSAENTLATGRLILNLQKVPNTDNRELLNVEAPEKLEITGSPDAKGEVSVITAEKGFFDYKADRIDFTGDVQASRGKSKLTGEKLQLYLGTAAPGAKPVAIPGVAAGAKGASRTLKRVLVTGNGVMSDEGNRMQGDIMEFFFTPALSGAASQPGLFQSGSLRLEKLIADGSVKLSNLAGNSEGNSGAMLGKETQFRELSARRMVSDMNSNTTVFTDEIFMTDGTNQMNCDKLEFFARRKAAPPAVKEPVIPADPNSDPDADPFDLPADKGVPRTIAIGNGLELDRSIATGNVIIHRTLPFGQEGEKLYCDRAFFNSENMTVECTGENGNLPCVTGSGKTHKADKFTLHLRDERLESSGTTVTE